MKNKQNKHDRSIATTEDEGFIQYEPRHSLNPRDTVEYTKAVTPSWSTNLETATDPAGRVFY